MIRTFVLCVAFSAFNVASVVGQDQVGDQDNSDLPKVVLVGDSIRLSYASVVAKELNGKAIVVSPKPNGGDSNNVLKNLTKWVIEEDPDVVHFNCGIHDTKKFHATGKFQVSPDLYEENLREIVQQIHDKTDAIVLFANTTPILDTKAAAARRNRDYALLAASVEQYNRIAVRVMTELKVPINDLHGLLTDPPAPHSTVSLISNDGVHLVQPARELVGKQVADLIQEYLPNKQD